MKNIGKMFYRFIHNFFSLLLSFFIHSKVQTWYRNSLKEDYFSFGNSDLDLSILYSTDDNLLPKIKLTQDIARKFIIIKEMNFYYPFAIQKSFQLINPLELQRDPVLEKILSPTGPTSLPSDKLVYFLRTFFSIKTDLNQPLTKRQVQKWNFHLKKILENKFVTTNNNSTDVLTIIITMFFPHQSEVITKDISNLYLAVRNKINLDHFFDEALNKEFYLIFFPQYYCYKKTAYSFNNEFQVELFLKQASWEIWAMVTQPWIFNDISGFTHLENIKNVILNSPISDDELKKHSLNLTKIIDEYISFISIQEKIST